MTLSRIAVVVVAASIFAAALSGGVSGQAAAPGPAGASPDCMTYLLNASDCLTFVSAGSNASKPDKGCCPEFAGLVDSNPICLCSLLGSQNSFGLQIDTKKALTLPSICGVTTPPVSLCSEIGIPVGSPTSSGEMSGSPSPTSADFSSPPSAAIDTPSASVSPGSAPAAAVPSSTTTEASSIGGHSLLMLFSLVIAFAAVLFN